MRDHFHVPDNYFLTHSVGCQPKESGAHIQAKILDPWRAQGGDAWPTWMEVIEEFRTKIGAVLGVGLATICPQNNVSSALTKTLYSLPKKPGRNIIVLSEQDFPTNGFVFKQATRAGYDLRFVKHDITKLGHWADALDDRVALVHITHALSNTSQLLPVGDICKLARGNGSFSVVDIAQSVGITPINLTDWQADFALGSSVKFLCGGPGACFLYVSPRVIPQCQPLDVGWFSHENPFEMDIHNFCYAPDAMRFFGGTPSPLPYASALSALNIWQNVTIEQAHAHGQALLDDLSACVPTPYLVSPLSAENRGGTLVVAPPKREILRTALHENGILFDERPPGFRFSVHGYTQKIECTRLAEIFRKTF